MAESKSTLESAREWIVEHKLRTVGVSFWVAFAYCLLLHAQFLTLAALAGAAVVEYYHKAGAKAGKYYHHED
ncbi:hypothetical protein SAY87_012465 [Trapa incisa]|uniref:Uncharacterized protein n=1 Tax=Trapa incisa TaxID=236973 RepID=A0AAN7JK69_9MYRT|nr:hypothetical protein SAY87_012465 [Trapa incisa]